MPNINENMEDEEVIDTNTTEDTTNENNEESSNSFTQEDLDRVVSQEKARIDRKYRKELEKEKEKSRKLETTLRAGLGLSEDEDVLTKVQDFYKEQGISIPDVSPSINNRDAEILGKSDAREIIDTGTFEEIEARANELAIKQQKNKTSARENAEFFALGEYLTSKLKEKELKDSGVDTSILENKDFKDFAKKFNSNTKMSEIYKLWNKMNGESKPNKPVSTGSSKSTVPDNKEKEYYTPEEVDKLTSKDLDNPTIFSRVRKSMTMWGNRKDG